MTDLCHRAFYFFKENHLWMNNKHIQDNRLMDAAIIFRGYNKYSNKHTLYVKIMKAMKKLESDDAVTNKQ